jgi:hypothetical protein
VRHAALALDAENEPRSAKDQPMLLIDDQDRQPHGIVVDAVQETIDPEFPNVGIPVRARRCLATLRGDALADVDTPCLSLDHALESVQPHLLGIRPLQGNVFGCWPIVVAPLDLANHFERDVGQRPRWALQPACFEPVGDDLVQLLALGRTAASAIARVRQEPPDVAGVLIPAQPGPQRPPADTGSDVRSCVVCSGSPGPA